MVVSVESWREVHGLANDWLRHLTLWDLGLRHLLCFVWAVAVDGSVMDTACRFKRVEIALL